MSDSIVFLPLTQGQVAIIDFEDFERVGRFTWAAAKTSSGDFYAVRGVGGRKNPVKLRLHNEVLGVKGVDHKNGNGLDCRHDNLRRATPGQNAHGFRRKSSGVSSQFRGVHWNKLESKWVARIRMKGLLIHLGYFRQEESAARAYDKKAIELGFFQEALNFSTT